MSLATLLATALLAIALLQKMRCCPQHFPILLAWVSWLMNSVCFVTAFGLSREGVGGEEKNGEVESFLTPAFVFFFYQFLVQLLFSVAHRRWIQGRSDPFGAAANLLAIIYNMFQIMVVTMIASVSIDELRPFILMLLASFSSLLVGWKQFQITNALALHRVSEERSGSLYMPLTSQEVEEGIPEITPLLKNLMSAASSRRFSQIQRQGAKLSQLASSYRIKLQVTIASSTYSMIAVSFNMQFHLQWRPVAKNCIDPFIVSVLALVLAAKTILDCVLSLLHDHGHSWAPLDKSMRSTVGIKAFLTSTKVVITVQERFNSEFRVSDSTDSTSLSKLAFAGLLSSAAVSFGASIFLSWKSFKTENARILANKGQPCSKSIMWAYRLLWVTVKGGMVLFGVLASCSPLRDIAGNLYDYIKESHLDSSYLNNLGVRYVLLGMLFACGSLLVNELALMQADPDKDFSAINCGGGGRVLSIFVVLFCPYVLELLDEDCDPNRQLELNYCFFMRLPLWSILACSLLLLCTLAQQPEKGSTLSSLS